VYRWKQNEKTPAIGRSFSACRKNFFDTLSKFSKLLKSFENL